MAHGKKFRAAAEKIEAEKKYDLEEACSLASETGTANFDESIDMVIRLGVDPRKADQNVRGSIALPNGLGKKVRIAVFAEGDKAAEAKEAGADIVGSDDLVEQVKAGNLDFDSVVATPDMMAQIGKIGRILGPRNLMPSPKVGTVTNDVAKIIATIKSGLAEYKLDKEAAIHVSIGRKSFGGQKLKENAEALITALNKVKPQSSKGIYFKSAAMSATMGPGIEIDMSVYR